MKLGILGYGVTSSSVQRARGAEKEAWHTRHLCSPSHVDRPVSMTKCVAFDWDVRSGSLEIAARWMTASKADKIIRRGVPLERISELRLTSDLG
jgi:hypothetical protein